MALQTSGAISLNDIHVEAGGSSGTQASINDTDIRGLIGKGSGVQMAFSEWYGAANEVTLTSATAINGQSNRQQITASTYVSSGGTLVIPANFWVWSDSTATAALIIDVPCTIKNYGNIIGKGGDGAYKANGNAGGPAITINASLSGVTIINYSGAYIAGGGGSGAASSSAGDRQAFAGGGGGAGGGAGGTAYGNAGTVAGGAGGILNASGSDGAVRQTADGSTAYQGQGGGSGGQGGNADDSGSGNGASSGGGGGRILPGTGGAYGIIGGTRSAGGNGGSANAAGAYHPSGGGGGGWGAVGGNAYQKTGGAAGVAINDNGNTYTLTDSGTIYGAT